MPETPKIAIVMPLMNDWAPFQQLLADLDTQLASSDAVVDVHVVDDFSIPPVVPDVVVSSIQAVYCTRLVRNVGHQRAIAIGLVHLHTHYDYSHVLVMDADGEDCPADAVRLIAQSHSIPDTVIVAERKTRSEGLVFRVFYRLYKFGFRILTGKVINFGNFCLIPQSALDGLVYHAGLWNHLASTIVVSRLPIHSIQTNRCQRYAGKSSMNFTALVIHGLSAMSIFLEHLAVRALITSLIGMVIGIIGLLVVIWIRVYTDLAIPGWATSATGLLLLITGQTILVILFITFTILQQRATMQIIPKNDVLQFVASHQQLT
ncbi:MAG: glycosyltransferase [Chloroflexota bacterium]